MQDPPYIKPIGGNTSSKDIEYEYNWLLDAWTKNEQLLGQFQVLKDEYTLYFNKLIIDFQNWLYKENHPDYSTVFNTINEEYPVNPLNSFHQNFARVHNKHPANENYIMEKINGKTIEKSFTFDNATRSNRISQLITLLFILNKIGKEHLDLHHENVMIENSTGWIKVIDPKDREDDSDTDDLETSSDKTEIFKLIKNNILSEPTDKSNGPPKGPNKKRQKTEFNKSESSVRTMSFDGGYKQMFPIKYIQGLGPKK